MEQMPNSVSLALDQSSGVKLSVQVMNQGQQAAAASAPVVLAADQIQDLFIQGAPKQLAAGINLMTPSGAIGAIDTVSGFPVSFHSFYMQIIGSAGIASGAIIFEGNNDNGATWNPVDVFDDASATSAPISGAIAITASTTRFFSGKIEYRYLRCRISTVFAGGTLQAFTRLTVNDYTPVGRGISDLAGAATVGNSQKPTYTYCVQGLALTATPANLFTIEAGAAKVTRIRRITIQNPGAQTTAGLVVFNLTRTTTAGSNNAVTPPPLDSSDPAFSGIVRSAAGTPGTLGTVVYQFAVWVPTVAAYALPFIIDWDAEARLKPPTIPAAVTNGMVLQVATGNIGAANLACAVEFTEESA